MRDARGAEFDDFVRSRSDALLRAAYLLTGDRHAAEDLVQEVLEQVFVRWPRIHTTPEAYARRALVNRAANRWRRRARRPEQALGEFDPPTDDHAGDVALREAVVAALRDVPYRQRAAVVLRYPRACRCFLVEMVRYRRCDNRQADRDAVRVPSPPRKALHGTGHCEMVQRRQGLRLHHGRRWRL